MADVTIRELASELEIDRSQLRKWIIKQLPEVSIHKIRDPNGSGLEVIAVSSSEADKIREARTNWNGSRVPRDGADQTQFGVFYAIQLLPEIYPTRIKFGYATDVDDRLMTHRCTCPNADVLKTWRCDPKWEQTALAVVRNLEESVHVGGEVYDCTSFDIVVERLDAFFDMLTPTEE